MIALLAGGLALAGLAPPVAIGARAAEAPRTPEESTPTHGVAMHGAPHLHAFIQSFPLVHRISP